MKPAVWRGFAGALKRVTVQNICFEVHCQWETLQPARITPKQFSFKTYYKTSDNLRPLFLRCPSSPSLLDVSQNFRKALIKLISLEAYNFYKIASSVRIFRLKVKVDHTAPCKTPYISSVPHVNCNNLGKCGVWKFRSSGDSASRYSVKIF